MRIRRVGTRNHGAVMKATCSCGVGFKHLTDARRGTSQLVKSMQQHGWRVSGNRVTCPNCIANERFSLKKKETDMQTQEKVVQDIRKPTPEDRRKIMAELNDCYDIEVGCYAVGETDQTIADRLKVMRGWVTEIRTQFFGESGANDEMLNVRNALDGLIKSTEEHGNVALEFAAKSEQRLAELKTMRERVAALMKAFGQKG
jgi:hypothetical protein